jgi:hypothetical protein
VSRRTYVLVAVGVLLTSCSGMLAPTPDGVVWLNGCDVGYVTEGRLTLITEGDGFCPGTVDVDASGIIWGAADPGDVRLVAGDRWVRIAGDPSPGWPDEASPALPVEDRYTTVIDMAVGTDGRVWLVSGVAEDYEFGGGYMEAEVRSFDGEAWWIFSHARGTTSFGHVTESFEPPERILASLPGGRMALVTSEGLFHYRSGRWTRLLAGDFTSVSSTPEGSLWIAGPSGVYMWPAEELLASATR